MESRIAWPPTATRASARRRKHERQAGSAQPPAAEPTAVHELQSILDEEIGQLPEIDREPFVLCCLEGRSGEEVAARLGVAPDDSRQPAQPRPQGAARAPGAAGGVSGGSADGHGAHRPGDGRRAEVVTEFNSPGGDVHRRGTDPQGPGARGRRRPCRRSESHHAAEQDQVGALGGCWWSGWPGPSLLALARAERRAARRGKEQASRQSEKEQPAKAKPAEDDQQAEVTARVIGDDDRPIAGAEVSVWSFGDTKPGDTRATSGKDGRFRLKLRPSERERETRVIVRAKGHVPDWAAARPGAKELTLRLSKTDVPIEGQVLDLEGKPIAGATVAVGWVDKPADGGDLKSWIESWKGPGEKRPAPKARACRSSGRRWLVWDQSGRAAGLGHDRQGREVPARGHRPRAHRLRRSGGAGHRVDELPRPDAGRRRQGGDRTPADLLREVQAPRRPEQADRRHGARQEDRQAAGGHPRRGGRHAARRARRLQAAAHADRQGRQVPHRRRSASTTSTMSAQRARRTST